MFNTCSTCSLRKLYSFEVPTHELITIYQIFIRSVLEQSALVWHSSLTEDQRTGLERIQRVALRIILKDDYESYEEALKTVKIETLDNRREHLCLEFATACTKDKSANIRDTFPLNNERTTRNPEKFVVQYARRERLKKSAIPYMQRLLNKFNSTKKN